MEDYNFMGSDSKSKTICAIISLVSLVTTILIGISFGSVEPTEYGILYNTITKKIDEKNILTGGLQYLGVPNKIITFPRVNKQIEFSDQKAADAPALSTRTKEGLELKLHFSFQYLLQKDQLVNLYRLVGTDYNQLYTRIASDVILANAGNYHATEYWQKRSEVGNQLEKALNVKLQEAFANCTGLMLLKIDLPDSYEDAIVDTQLVNQQRLTQEKVKSINLILAGIEVDNSVANQNISIINAEAQYNATIYSNNINAKMIKNTVTKQAEAYTQAKKDLQFDNSKNLLDFVYYLNIMNLDKKKENNKLIIGVDNPRVTLQEVGKGYNFAPSALV
ncbi:UNKNOWN [Stylonychia lemnae]|uniref:Band 7 domain-containing protein n=1 Tax=Stylonychia lemnae TaxID=5949 RepID=A0A078AX98_STYLE|nr:UNKNOWN [Stylonychia lemnae]|eukprot:CDW85393.1 UNKNOWN [Stylonychia lemnae]